jgi:hypothetical protein
MAIEETSMGRNYELIAKRLPFKPNIAYHVSFHEPPDVQWRYFGV